MAGLKYKDITDDQREKFKVLIDLSDGDSLAKLQDDEEHLDPDYNHGHPLDAEDLLSEEDKQMLQADKEDQQQQADEEAAAQQAEQGDQPKKNEVQKAFDVLEKARVGTYKDNPENRSKKRVGQKYGQEAQKTTGAERVAASKTQKSPHVGGRWETFEKYKDDKGNYIESRVKEVHRPYLAKLFHDAGGAQETPTLILTAGGSAAGKGTMLKNIISPSAQEQGMKMAIVDSDDIKMAHIPEFQEFQKEDAETAAQRTHRESSDVTAWANQELIKHKRNFVYDGTMKDPEKYKKLIKAAKDRGFHVQIAVANVDVDTALQRNKDRFERTGRLVPDDIVKESHASVSKSFAELKDMVDDWHVYDMSDGGRLVATTDGIMDQKAYDAFTKKHEGYLGSLSKQAKEAKAANEAKGQKKANPFAVGKVQKSFEALGLVKTPHTADGAPERINWEKIVRADEPNEGNPKKKNDKMVLRYTINKAGQRVGIMVRLGTNANLKS